MEQRLTHIARKQNTLNFNPDFYYYLSIFYYLFFTHMEVSMSSIVGLILAFTAAGLTVALCGVGSILAISVAGRAGAGIATEKPEAFGKLLIMAALPGSQGIYGFVGAFMILNSVGALGGQLATVELAQGIQFIVAALPLIITGLLSAIHQGRVAVAGMNMIAKDPSTSGQALSMAVLVETYAILGLLISLFMIWAVKLA